MSAYATAVEFRSVAYQSKESDDAKYGTLLEAASRAFDRFVGVADQYFDPADSATVRVLYPSGTAYLKLPPYVAGSLTTITMPAGFTVPYNVEKDGYLIVTDSRGVINPGESIPSHYPNSPTSALAYWLKGVPVSVTARWGFVAVPADVKQVVIEIAISMWRAPDPAFAKTADLPGLKEELSPIAQSIIGRYLFKKAALIA